MFADDGSPFDTERPRRRRRLNSSARDVRSRAELEAFVRRLGTELGIKPVSEIWRAVERGTPAGLLIRALIQASPKLFVKHRPRNVSRALKIWRTVRDLVEDGHTESVAFKLAPQILYDENIRGKGPAPKPLSVASVREAYKREQNVVAEAYFEEPTDND